MKMALTLKITCVLTVGLFLIGTGCKQDNSDPGKDKKWELLIEIRKKHFNLLTVEESQQWLEDNPNPTHLDLALKGIFIDVDPNGNRRVFQMREIVERNQLEEFMSTEDSIAWLEAQGYEVERNDNGYILKREVVSEGITIRESSEIGWGATIVRGTIIKTTSGDIRIKVGGTQQ